MTSLNKTEKSILKWAAMVGVFIVAITGIQFWGFTNEAKESPKFFMWLGYVLPILYLVPEAIVLKAWKKYIVIFIPAVLYGIVPRHFVDSTVSFENYQLFYTLMPSLLITMLLRNLLFSKGRSILTVVVGTFLVLSIKDITNGLSYELTSIVIVQDGVSISWAFDPIISALIFWLSIFLYDRLSPPKHKTASFYNMERSLNGTEYFKKVKLLSLLQMLIALLLAINLSGMRDNYFVTGKTTVGLLTAFLFVHALIYIISSRRLIATNKRETYLFRFSLPFLSLIPAYTLSKAEEGNKYIDKIEENRRLVFCRNCNNRKSDLKRGTFCGLTSEKPDFEGQCKDFSMVEKLSPARSRLAPTQLTKPLMFFLIILAFYTLFLLFVSVSGGRLAPDMTETIVTILVFWTLGYFIYHQKLWAVGVFLALITFNALYGTYNMESGTMKNAIIIMYSILSFPLIVGIMPLWRYIAKKPLELRDVLEV